jgi:hypothetical protein
MAQSSQSYIQYRLAKWIKNHRENSTFLANFERVQFARSSKQMIRKTRRFWPSISQQRAEVWEVAFAVLSDSCFLVYEKLSIIQTVARSMSAPTEPADKR